MIVEKVFTTLLFLIVYQFHTFQCMKSLRSFNPDNKQKYLSAAGCKSNGELLDIGVCTDAGYRPHITPKTGSEKPLSIYTTINYQNIRDVDDKKGN